MLGLEEGQRFQSEGGAASLHLIQPASASAATPLSKQRSCVPSNEPDCCKVELSEAPSGHNTAPPTAKAPRPPPSAPAAVDRVIRAAAAAPGSEGGGRGGRDGDGFTFICLSCPETFPISDLDAVTDHIATGFYKADGRCSAALDFLAQRVKLTVNDAARTVSANTLLSCKDCGAAEFDVNKRGEDVIGDIHRHLTTECRGGGAAAMKKQKKKGRHLGGNLCPFCDRRISASAGGDMSAHLADRRFRRAHYERLRAMLTCGCKSLLLAAAAAANDDDLRCKLCSKPNRRPHPALPGWLSKSACDKCLRSTVAKIERGGRAKERVVVVLCAFCKQGKFGYDGGKGCSSVCVNCFDLLDSFRRQLPAPMMSNDGGGAAAECRNYVYGILNELVRKEGKNEEREGEGETSSKAKLFFLLLLSLSVSEVNEGDGGGVGGSVNNFPHSV